MANKIRLGHRETGGTQHPMPNVATITTNDDESQGYRLHINPAGGLVITKFNNDKFGDEAVSIKPNNSNQITLS